MFTEKYHSSGIQRETRELQQRHNEKMLTDFLGEPFDEQKFSQTVTEMFHLGEPPSPEELYDVRIFAEYTIPRLTSSATHQPHLQRIFQKKDSALQEVETDLFRGAPLGTNLIGHDLIHASVAYLESGGKNLRPKYNSYDLSLGGLGEDDIDCVREEMVVLVFQGQLLFKEMMSGTLNTHQSLREWLIVNKYGSEIEKIEILFGEEGEASLNQSVTLESILRFIEFLGVYLASTEQKALDMWHTLGQERSPYFTELVQGIFNNAQEDIPDQKFLLHEWQRLMIPLLKRLRRKSEMRKDSSD